MQEQLFGRFDEIATDDIVAELHRRYAEAPPRPRIRTPQDALICLEPWRSATQEHFFALTLDGAHQVTETRVVSVGLVNRCAVHAREVFRGAIADNAVAVIIAHNHPSGSLEPSPEDDAVTRRLVEAGKILGIPVLDSLIVSTVGFYSYLEHDAL